MAPPAAETVRDKYNRWHERTAAEDPAHSDSPWHRMAKPYLGDVAGINALEVGCGLGGFSQYLAGRGARVVATDLSFVAARETRRLVGAGRLRGVCVADVQRLPLPDDCFDLVVCFESFEHVVDQDAGLRELVRVTAPGGRLFVTTPSYLNLMGAYRAYRDWAGRPFGEIGQPPRKPLNLPGRVRRLERLGCRVDVVDGCGHYLLWPGRLPIRLAWLDRPRWLTKWVAFHSLTVATKPPRPPPPRNPR